MRSLIAVKPLVYATRRLLPGQDFLTRTSRDARILVATGKARYGEAVDEEPAKSTPKPAPKAHEPDPLSELRATYKDVVGKRAHHSWDAEELQRRIDEAKEA